MGISSESDDEEEGEEVTSEEGGDLEKEVDSYITFLVINEKKFKKESDLLW